MVSYLIKCIVCSGILLAVYHFLLAREKMFRFNRFYLLGAMVFALLAPLVIIEMPLQMEQEMVTASPVMPPPHMTAANDSPPTGPAQESTNVPDYLPWLLYWFVAAVLLTRTGFQMLAIDRSRRGLRTVPFKTAQLVLTPGDTPTYSFFKFIFIPEKAFDNQSIPNEILTHELAHARQMHSADIVFTELLIALWWFNPLLLLYRRAIRLNHEYLADEAVLAGHSNVSEYQLLLLDTLLAQRTNFLASSFNYPFTKKRLAMMTTNINLRMQFVKKALVALLLPAMAFVLAEKSYSQEHTEKPSPHSKAADADSPAANGVSKEELDRFYAVMEKHTRYVPNSKGHRRPVTEMDDKTMREEYEIYARMSEEQQLAANNAGISMYKEGPPVKNVPSEKMFENWKKPHIFGIWIDGKHVPNTRLNSYKNTDIAEYTLHKLVGRGLRVKNYKYQLELTTNEEFDRTFEERSRDNYVLVRFLKFKRIVEAGTKK